MCESSEWDSTTACYYGPCDWQRVGGTVIAEVCLRWRGPSGERMLSRRRHAEPGPVLMTHPSHPVHRCVFTLLISSLSRAGDTRGTATQWLGVLKDFTCLDFSTSGLVRSRSSSHVNSLQSWQTCFCLLDWGGESDPALSVLPAVDVPYLFDIFISVFRKYPKYKRQLKYLLWWDGATVNNYMASVNILKILSAIKN